jgi:hypothetical protein
VTGHEDLPDGEYGFVELYCNETGCDCRRVVITVLRPENGWSRIWATIGYGWESVEFYEKWGLAGSDPADMKGPYLDPLNPQSRYSPALLDLFRLLIQSPDYVQRLKRHYQMFRDSVEQKQRGLQDIPRLDNRRKRLRHPKGRRGRSPAG